MLASWLSAGLLVAGALLGCLGAYLQDNALLVMAGVGLLLGIITSGFTEWQNER